MRCFGDLAIDIVVVTLVLALIAWDRTADQHPGMESESVKRRCLRKRTINWPGWSNKLLGGNIKSFKNDKQIGQWDIWNIPFRILLAFVIFGPVVTMLVTILASHLDLGAWKLSQSTHNKRCWWDDCTKTVINQSEYTGSGLIVGFGVTVIDPEPPTCKISSVRGFCLQFM